MNIREQTTNVPLSLRELALIREVCIEFVLNIPEATDVQTLEDKMAMYEQIGVFE